MSLKRAYPNAPTKCDKSDIDSAFRQIRLRPESFALFPTEFDGLDFGLDYDIIVGYLALPFGRAGAPGVFAGISDIVTRYRRHSSPANALWSDLFADDGISTEPDFPDRLIRSSSTWGPGSYMVIGTDSPNKDKLQIDGQLGSMQIISGCEVEFASFAITSPKEINYWITGVDPTTHI